MREQIVNFRVIFQSGSTHLSEEIVFSNYLHWEISDRNFKVCCEVKTFQRQTCAQKSKPWKTKMYWPDGRGPYDGITTALQWVFKFEKRFSRSRVSGICFHLSERKKSNSVTMGEGGWIRTMRGGFEKFFNILYFLDELKVWLCLGLVMFSIFLFVAIILFKHIPSFAFFNVYDSMYVAYFWFGIPVRAPIFLGAAKGAA